MTTFGAAAVGAFALITSQLGKGRPAAPAAPESGDGAPEAGAPEAGTPKVGAPAFGEKQSGKPSGSGPLVLITRAEWGAVDPAVSPDGRGEYGPYDASANPNGWLTYDQPLAEVLNTVIVHHSALPLTDGPREIQKLHMEEKGFADIGYQYLIGPDGQLYEGRAINVRGAHTYGANYGSIGICVIGNFEEIEPSSAQQQVLKALIAALIKQYPRIDHLAGHRDFNPNTTLCPGANLYTLLPGLAEGLAVRYGV